jgi:hypothetical protein
MGNRFTSGKRAIAMCDRCGQQFLLKLLKIQTFRIIISHHFVELDELIFKK